MCGRGLRTVVATILDEQISTSRAEAPNDCKNIRRICFNVEEFSANNTLYLVCYCLHLDYIIVIRLFQDLPIVFH